MKLSRVISFCLLLVLLWGALAGCGSETDGSRIKVSPVHTASTSGMPEQNRAVTERASAEAASATGSALPTDKTEHLPETAEIPIDPAATEFLPDPATEETTEPLFEIESETESVEPAQETEAESEPQTEAAESDGQNEEPTGETETLPDRSVLEETDPDSEAEPEITYIANKNTKKFHYPNCSSVRDMKESNKLYFTGTRDELIEAGYTPCKRCNP